MARCEIRTAFVSLNMFDCYTLSSDGDAYVWHPDAANYRKTDQFKNQMRQNILAYWQESGFPTQCRQLEGDDFECD